MYKNKKISIYFPCRNESNHLHLVVDSVPDFVDEIILVSNKSTDNTEIVANTICKNNPKVRFLIDNREIDGIGYGFASITGLMNATGDIIVSSDADLTYPLDVLTKILDHFLENEIDFLSCNRYPIKSSKIPLLLQIGVNTLNLATHLFHRVKIQDILSGMWVVSKDKRDLLNLGKGDWNLSPEIKIKAARHKDVKFSEYHINQNIRAGSTNQSYFKTGFNHLQYIIVSSMI